LFNQIESWQIQSREGLMHQFHVDLPLLVAVLLASFISAIAIFSASNGNEAFLTSHLIRVGLSIVTMISLLLNLVLYSIQEYLPGYMGSA